MFFLVFMYRDIWILFVFVVVVFWLLVIVIIMMIWIIERIYVYVDFNFIVIKYYSISYVEERGIVVRGKISCNWSGGGSGGSGGSGWVDLVSVWIMVSDLEGEGIVIEVLYLFFSWIIV